MAQGIPARLSASDGRKFAFTVGIAFLAVAALTWWRGHAVVTPVAAVLGGTLLVAGALAPTRIGPLYRGWMRMAHAISKVTTPIFMGLVYVLVIFPTGWVLRLFGHRPLVHEARNDSFWIVREAGHEQRRGTMTNQF